MPQAALNAPASNAPTGALLQKADPRAGKYITFGLGKEEFAIPVLRVREIVGIQEITGVPNTPHGVKGVINLRGKVIPVVEPFGYPSCTCRRRVGRARSARAGGRGDVLMERRRRYGRGL